MIAAPMPCTAREALSITMSVAAAQASEATVKMEEADREHRAATDAVGERAGRQHDGGERERVGVDDPLQAGEAGVEVGGDVGERGVDDRDVEHEHRGGGAHDGEGPALRCGQGGAPGGSGEVVKRYSRRRAGSASGVSLVGGSGVAGGAEDVVRVPPGLHAREALVVRAVGRAHAVVALVAGEVEVGGAGAVGRERLAPAAAVGDGPLVLGGVLPQQQRVDDEARAPAGQRLAFGAARDGAAPGGDQDLRAPRREVTRPARRSRRWRPRRGRRGIRRSTSCGSRAGRRARTGRRRSA